MNKGSAILDIEKPASKAGFDERIAVPQYEPFSTGKLKELMKKKGVSLTDMIEQDVIPEGTLKKLHADQGYPSYTTLKRLGEYFGVDFYPDPNWEPKKKRSS